MIRYVMRHHCCWRTFVPETHGHRYDAGWSPVEQLVGALRIGVCSEYLGGGISCDPCSMRDYDSGIG